MSSCNPTTVYTALQSWLTRECLDNALTGARPRNNRVKTGTLEVEHLLQHVDLNEYDPCLQNLQTLHNSLSHQTILAESSQELQTLIKLTVPIVQAKVLESQWTPPDEHELDELSKNITSHLHYPELTQIYSWKYFYEKLVWASAKPSKLSNSYHEFISVHNEFNGTRVV